MTLRSPFLGFLLLSVRTGRTKTAKKWYILGVFQYSGFIFSYIPQSWKSNHPSQTLFHLEMLLIIGRWHQIYIYAFKALLQFSCISKSTKMSCSEESWIHWITNGLMNLSQLICLYRTVFYLRNHQQWTVPCLPWPLVSDGEWLGKTTPLPFLSRPHIRGCLSALPAVRPRRVGALTCRKPYSLGKLRVPASGGTGQTSQNKNIQDCGQKSNFGQGILQLWAIALNTFLTKFYLKPLICFCPPLLG